MSSRKPRKPKPNLSDRRSTHFTPRARLGTVLASDFKLMILAQGRKPRPGEIQEKVRDKLNSLNDSQVKELLQITQKRV